MVWTLAGTRDGSSAARSRSISTAMMRATRGASARVSAPRPGPISRKVSSGAGATAAISLSTQACSRKCCPKRFRGRLPIVVFVGGDRLATPVLLFDFLDFFLAEPKVVSDFVDQRLADDGANLVLVFAVFLDGTLEQRDAVGQGKGDIRRALGQWGSLIEPVERVGRLDLHFFEQFRARFPFHDQRQVLHLAPETARDQRQRFSDELFERGEGHPLFRKGRA